MSTPGYTYVATLDRVIDGDTVVLNIDLGFRMTAKLPVRLNGLNCPEHGTPDGDAATAFTKAWFEGKTSVLVATMKDPEKYGRWLGTVTVPGGSTLNGDLLSADHAKSWDGKGSRPV